MFTDINIIAATVTLERHFHKSIADPRSSPALQVGPFFQHFPFVPSCHLHPTGAGITSMSTEWRYHNQTSLLNSYGTQRA